MHIFITIQLRKSIVITTLAFEVNSPHFSGAKFSSWF